MNALILAAGYATRLYPLTLNKAKPLLVVGGKPIIEWVVDNLHGVPDLETIYVVTNDKFAADFQAWSERYQNRHPQFKFKIVNDGSKSDDDKLGAIGDINFVVTREKLNQSSMLIIAGDNLFTESLEGFVICAKGSEATDCALRFELDATGQGPLRPRSILRSSDIASSFRENEKCAH